MTSEDEILVWADAYARQNGWVLNPDSTVLASVIRGLASNEKRFGVLYCPCRLRSGNVEKNRANICPWIYHRDEIERDDHCHCRLYYRKDATGPETGGQE